MTSHHSGLSLAGPLSVVVVLALLVAAWSDEASAAGAGVGAGGARVIELVSDPNKNANPVNSAFVSSSGDRVLYRIYGGTDQTTYGDTTSGYLIADRTEGGWKSSNPLPPRSDIPYDVMQLVSFTDPLSRFLFLAAPGIGVLGDSQYVAFNAGGPTGWGFRFASPVLPPGRAVVSEDLVHIFGTVGQPLVPGDPAGGGGLYDFAGEAAELVGLMPGDIAPECGVNSGNHEFANTSNEASGQHWSSVDGDRVFFHTRGGGDCSTAPNLYVRRAGPDGRLGAQSGSTTLISGPVLSGPDLGARFSQATPDGTEVFYTTASRIDPEDLNDGTDVYRYRDGQGNDCLTCVVSNAQVISRPIGTGEKEEIVVSEDGSRVYFSSPEALTENAVPGQSNTYVWRSASPNEIDYVAATAIVRDATAATTSDGGVLFFSASSPEMNALTHSDNGGYGQIYRYDDDKGDLQCLTCPAIGPATTAGVDGSGYAMTGFLSGPPKAKFTQDGKTLAFATAAALVERDINVSIDIYEWRDGRIGLITNGVSPSEGETTPRVAGLSADGRDIFFQSFAAETDVIDPSSQLYDARIGGGFPSVPPVESCDGDACQRLESGVSAARRAPASSLLRGLGDLKPPARDALSFLKLGPKQRARLAAGGSARLVVRVSGPGRVKLVARARIGRGTRVIASSTKVARRAGALTMSIRLSHAAIERVTRRGRLAIQLSLRFGSAKTRKLSFDLKELK